MTQSPEQFFFEDYEAERGQLQSLELESKSGSKLKIYYYPALNVEQEQAIYRHVGQDGLDTEVFLTNLIARALNEDGTRMFSEANRKQLRVKCSAKRLREIALKMGGVLESTDPKKP